MPEITADELLANLFNHITKPSKEWPQVTVGSNAGNWTTGGVDDEFRDYLVRVEKYLQDNPKYTW